MCILIAGFIQAQQPVYLFDTIFLLHIIRKQEKLHSPLGLGVHFKVKQKPQTTDS